MPFRICTIGCGNIATMAHGPSYARYAQLHPDTELTACCDLDEERAIAFRDRFGFARAYTDLEIMLDREQPHAVCLVSPVDRTCEISCAILQKGYPLMMEKPPGLTHAEIARMIAAADTSGAPTMVACNRSYAPLLCEIKSVLGARFQPSELHHIRYDLTRVGRTDPDFSTTAFHGVHTAAFLASSDYAGIRFHYQPLPDHGLTVANILMECTFESGATGHLSFCPVAGDVIERATIHAYNHTFTLHLPMMHSRDIPGRLQHFERGVCMLDKAGAMVGEEARMYVSFGFYGENAAFFNAVRNDQRPVVDLKSARQAVEIMQCIRERQSEYHKERAPGGFAVC